MERRNLIIAGVAVVLGLVAVYLANAWFTGTEQRQARSAEEQQLVRIAVANQDMRLIRRPPQCSGVLPVTTALSRGAERGITTIARLYKRLTSVAAPTRVAH